MFQILIVENVIELINEQPINKIMKKRLNETFENFRRKNHEQNRTCSSSSSKG